VCIIANSVVSNRQARAATKVHQKAKLQMETANSALWSGGKRHRPRSHHTVEEAPREGPLLFGDGELVHSWQISSPRPCDIQARPLFGLAHRWAAAYDRVLFSTIRAPGMQW
jgi:hypothetical protein